MAATPDCSPPSESGSSACDELCVRDTGNAGSRHDTCAYHRSGTGRGGARARGAVAGTPRANDWGGDTEDGADHAALPYDSDSGASSTASGRGPAFACAGDELHTEPLTPFEQLWVRPCPGRVTHFHCRGCGFTLRKQLARSHFTIVHCLQKEDLAHWLVIKDGADLGPQPRLMFDRLEAAYLQLAVLMGLCDHGGSGADLGVGSSAVVLPGHIEKRRKVGGMQR